MKLQRVLGTMALVVLLVPLSGCIGDDDSAPVANTGSGTEIEEGIPPKKFTFEPVSWKPTGEAVREKRVNEAQYPILFDSTTDWRITWKISGLPSLGVGDKGEETGETVYNLWLGKPDGNGGVAWEQVPRATTIATNGTIQGSSDWERRYRDYIGIMVTMETANDQTPEIPILMKSDMKPESTDAVQLEFQKPFAASFADANVVVAKDGKVNLTVKAFTLPETEGSYDVFIKNAEGTTYLGSLAFDPSVGGLAISVSPDPSLFSKYQFFISLEHGKDNKDKAGGFHVLTSRFG